MIGLSLFNRWVQAGLFTLATVALLHAQALPPGKPKSELRSSETDSQNVLGPGEDPENRLVAPFLKHLADDQKQFWTTPAHLKVKDLKWIVPFAGVTAAFVASDSWWARQVPLSHVAISKTISDYGAYSFIGLSGASFMVGHLTHDDHLRETGLLSAEAAINATGVAYLFKEATQRQRPEQGSGNGNFFAGGASFPSEHSAIAWSIASVFAHEYPGWLSQTAAYAAATAVSLTRVTAKQHFPSDVIVGSALGWAFGHQIYRAHHDPELGGSPWGSVIDDTGGDHTTNPKNMGSPYVPIDSWVYPVLDRLIALGYVHSAMSGMRPWTRIECAQLLEEANEKFTSAENNDPEVSHLLQELSSYFADEMKRLDGAINVDAKVDSLYTRATGISGDPLRDGFHLAQTIINDDGRPYSAGFNNVTGTTAYSEAGPLYIAFQGEYQQAPAFPSYPSSTLQQISIIDQTPLLPNGTSSVSRFRLLDSSIGFTFHNLQISFGKQSLWLGPGDSGPFLFSNNAEPIPMLRFDQVSPEYIPGLSKLLGPMRWEFALGRMDGAHWIFSNGVIFGPQIADQPFVHVDKVSFQPSPNFEFGMGISAVLGGPGLPLTFGNFFKSYNPSCAIGNCFFNLSATNADRRSTAEASYRIPHFRDWLTLYGDSLVEDEISPIGSSRPAIRAGIYMPKIPKAHNLDLRVESVYTDAPNTVFIGNYYDNGRYRSGYTNYGQIMGSWIGRAGKGGQAWMTYWFSPRSKLQLQYRREVVSKDFLPRGGGLNDFGIMGDFQIRSSLALQGFLQYETWNFPVLSTVPRQDFTASLQITFYPKWSLKK